MFIIKREIVRVREREREINESDLKKNVSGRFEPTTPAVKILNVTPRPILPSLKAWLEVASDNHSRIFTTLLQRDRESTDAV